MANTKLVNINACMPIKNINPPIYGIRENVEMTTSDILKCLCRRAIIDEILPDGTIVRLNMKNYHLDNTPEKKEVQVEEEHPEDPAFKPEEVIPPVEDPRAAKYEATVVSDGVEEHIPSTGEESTDPIDETEDTEEQEPTGESTTSPAAMKEDEAAETILVEDAVVVTDTAEVKATVTNNNRSSKNNRNRK